MSTETIEALRDLKAVRAEQCRQRRADAAAEYGDASQLAAEAGLSLLRRSDSHYQLWGGGRLLNVYPGNQRLYRDSSFPPFPKLTIPAGDWTLTDVVRAAIRTTNQPTTTPVT